MPTPIDTARVQELLTEGAQLLDVLPVETFRQEHLPGAVNVPIHEIDNARTALDASRPVIVYCYDYQCDLSGRGAHHLERLGFDTVYDYVASKAAWLAEGLPREGLLSDEQRAIATARRDVPRVKVDATIGDVVGVVAEWEVVVVVDADDVVLGVVRPEACSLPSDTSVQAVMQHGPPTVRPSISIRELAQSMDDEGQLHLLVSKLDGTLIGLVRRSDLDAV